jgi:hypothetical protein
MELITSGDNFPSLSNVKKLLFVFATTNLKKMLITRLQMEQDWLVDFTLAQQLHYYQQQRNRLCLRINISLTCFCR